MNLTHLMNTIATFNKFACIFFIMSYYFMILSYYFIIMSYYFIIMLFNFIIIIITYYYVKGVNCLYEGVIVPTVLYRAEARPGYEKFWEKENECSWDEVFEKFGWSVAIGNRVRNEEVRRRAGIERELASRADQRVLGWFRHVERIDQYRMDRRVLMADVSGGRVRGRPRLVWMDGVEVALGNRGMMVKAARQCAKDRKEWRALVHM